MYNHAFSNVAQGFIPEDYSAQPNMVDDDTAAEAGIQSHRLDALLGGSDKLTPMLQRWGL